MLAYLTSIFFGQHPQSTISVHTVKEMRTIAAALDSLLQGRLPELGDLLMQRLKAPETSVRDKDWGVASQLELTEETPGLVSVTERQAAARHALMKAKLAELRSKAQARGGTG